MLISMIAFSDHRGQKDQMIRGYVKRQATAHNIDLGKLSLAHLTQEPRIENGCSISTSANPTPHL